MCYCLVPTSNLPSAPPCTTCRITGYSRKEIVGRNCRFLQGPATDPATVSKLATALHEVRSCVVTLQRRAGLREAALPCRPLSSALAPCTFPVDRSGAAQLQQGCHSSACLSLIAIPYSSTQLQGREIAAEPLNYRKSFLFASSFAYTSAERMHLLNVFPGRAAR